MARRLSSPSGAAWHAYREVDERGRERQKETETEREGETGEETGGDKHHAFRGDEINSSVFSLKYISDLSIFAFAAFAGEPPKNLKKNASSLPVLLFISLSKVYATRL